MNGVNCNGGRKNREEKERWVRKGKLKVRGIWGVICKAVGYNIVEDSTNA